MCSLKMVMLRIILCLRNCLVNILYETWKIMFKLRIILIILLFNLKWIIENLSELPCNLYIKNEFVSIMCNSSTNKWYLIKKSTFFENGLQLKFCFENFKVVTKVQTCTCTSTMKYASSFRTLYTKQMLGTNCNKHAVLKQMIYLLYRFQIFRPMNDNDDSYIQ